MERACMYDIEIKYALGLRLDERPFDHSSLGDFRKRLLENGKEKEIFDKILGELVEKGLVKKDEASGSTLLTSLPTSPSRMLSPSSGSA
jgi:transposase